MIVHYYGGSAEAAGTSEETVEAAGGAGIAALAERLTALHPGLHKILGACSYFVDGTQVRGDVVLRSDARVDVLPPFAGG